jgi:uncharacterized OsmC-like protein
MSAQDIAGALLRVEVALQRRPEMGLHDDTPATAYWNGGTRIVASHMNGTKVLTDMPSELGGTGDKVTPGWLFRAGFASCAATSIAMTAARDGIDLNTLEVRVSSRSDTRGLLNMMGVDGAPVDATPRDVQLHVHIGAHGVSAERLVTLVKASVNCSPIPCAVQHALPVDLRIDVDSH